MRLNRDFFKNNPCAVKNLCNFIKNNADNTGFRMDENDVWLQVYSAKLKGYKNLISNKNSDWDVVSAQKAGTVNVIVTCVNNAIANFSDMQLYELFNTVHNVDDINNVRYYPI